MAVVSKHAVPNHIRTVEAFRDALRRRFVPRYTSEYGKNEKS